jgi:hypothetical protein
MVIYASNAASVLIGSFQVLSPENNIFLLGHSLDNRESIKMFLLHFKDLRPFELSDDEWNAITLVMNWLKSFRSATTQMSATKIPMLSTTHAIFRGLQSDLQDILCSLPDTAAPELIKGLTDAHLKLSDYYFKFDESPYYLWSARKFFFYVINFKLLLTNFIVLDPRISYSALKDEFEDDIGLSSHLEIVKDDLQNHYKTHYAPAPPSLSKPSQPSISATSKASPQKNFISRFNRKPRTSTDELLEFWSLPQEDIETCDPLHWWYGRRAQFPNLYRLVRDIFSIPGA